MLRFLAGKERQLTLAAPLRSGLARGRGEHRGNTRGATASLIRLFE